MTSPSTTSSTAPLLALALALVGLAVVGGIVGRRPSAAEGAPAALTRSSPPPPSLPPPPLPTLEELAEAQAAGRDLDREAGSEEAAPEASAAPEYYTGVVALQNGGLTVADEEGVVILRVSPDDLRTAQVVEDPFAPTAEKRCLVLADGSRVVLPPELGRGALPRTVEYDRPASGGAQPE